MRNRLILCGWVLSIQIGLAQAAGPAVSKASPEPVPAGAGLFWYKGNTHTHTWWSDGDSPPETVVKWYKDHGYQFLMLSDHNKLAEGEKWYKPSNAARQKAAETYEDTFGSEWISKRGEGKDVEYRLKTLAEFREMFRDPNFLLLQGEEISASFEKRPVHVNGVNLVEVIEPQTGSTMAEAIENNVKAVTEQSARHKKPMLAHVNHPNFQWSTTAEDLAPLKSDRFFEVYNGHSGVNNDGDDNRPSCERMWDIMLTQRLAELKLPVMYGVATDDAHCYTKWGVGNTNPGRGWVVVRAGKLDADELVRAMQRGDFYASTGVMLKDIRFENNVLSIEIDARPDVSYTTQFIGTLEGYNPKPADRYKDPKGFLVNKYDESIGQVLAEVSGPQARYKLTGKEIYVRAKVISTARHPNPFKEGDVEVAWVQPVVPAPNTAAPQPVIR